MNNKLPSLRMLLRLMLASIVKTRLNLREVILFFNLNVLDFDLLFQPFHLSYLKH